jgi:SH3 domain protein
MPGRPVLRGRVALGAFALCAIVLGTPAHGEVAWIKDELRINLRSGPGVQFRILGRLKTGDRLEVLQRGDGWTEVRTGDQGDGWIPEGYLQGAPPAGMRLAQSEAATEEFREQIDSLAGQVDALGQENASLAARDGEQRAEIERLTGENRELKAGARWPEWITGASILGAGMAIGAILRGTPGRRGRKIRL